MSRFLRARLPHLLILALAVLSLPGVSHAAPSSQLRDEYSDATMAVTLESDSVPNLGGIATLTFTATPLVDAPDLTVRWLLPEGVELLGDAEQTFGAIAPMQTVQVTRQVRFPNEGTFQISVNAVFHWGDAKQFGSTGVLFFKVRTVDSLVSDLDPDLAEKERIPDDVVVTFTPDESLSDPNAPDDICITVRGTIQRQEFPPLTNGGFGPMVIVPVRAGTVEVREEDIVFDDSYGEFELTATGGGFYAKSFCDDDGWFDDELEMYIRISSEGSYGEVENYGAVWDDVYDINILPARSIERSGNLDISVILNEQHSAIFNILEAVTDAHRFWNQTAGISPTPPFSWPTVNVNWERGKGYSGSRYRSFWDEIIIADNPSDPDEWDDSVIIHEWGHFADDKWSCDESPGGPHNFTTPLADAELSFGEGYPDYYQSVVRQWRNDPNDPNAQFYIDAQPGGGGFSVNFEAWNVPNNPNNPLVSIQTEDAIAAALWDLHDNVVDGSDTVAWGHATIQSVYTSDDYEDADNCNWRTFQRAWKSTGKPTDGPTGQTIVQNVGPRETFALALQEVSAVSDAPDAPASLHDVGPGEADWWNKLVFVVDNSASMAGGKFNGVKTVLDEAVNDLGQAPQGTEFSLYTFNNTSGASQLLSGRFFPEDITPVIAGLNTVAGPDATCPVSAFRALAQAVDNRHGVDAWVMTDGDTTTFAPSVEGMKSILLNRRVRASFAVMGVCAALLDESPTAPAQTQENLNLLRGMVRPFLGLATDPTPGGIVPYLLTAIASGGQFLWVSPGYENLAGDILRAQMTHSAGAGRWSDYVSNTPTYRFDTLASWEYQWIDGANQVIAATGEIVKTVSLPDLFTLYGSGAYYGTVDVYQDGYIVIGPYGGPMVANNTALPNPSQPNSALYPFWDDLSVPIPPNAQSPQFGGSFGQIYTKQQGEWFVIEYRGFKRNLNDPGLTFEVLLNLTTYEIRYQYKDVPGGAGSATIGLENAAGTDAIQISFNDINGAQNNMGYKFVPAPPQPSKEYTVAVDSLMQGVGFLLTGYNVGFAAGMTVRDPNGVEVNCAEQGTLCLYLGGRVQYIQTNVNGRTGIWTATVTANGPGTHTFSFSSMAAGALPVKSRGRHVISTVGGARILLDLGQPVDGNTLTGWMLRPDNRPIGSQFMLYDDGQHNDERASDGIFGSDPFTTGAAGLGYLRVTGRLGGVEFVRSDPSPYLFQPLRVQPLGDGVNMGGATNLTFRIINDDAFSHCYNLDVRAPEGWTATLASDNICMGPNGTTADVPVTVWLAGEGQNNNLASGTTGTVTFSVVENEKGSMSASAQAEVSRHRPPASIIIHNLATDLRPNGDQATVRVSVFDEQLVSAADGTPVQIATSLGTVNPANGTLQDGWLYFTFTTGPETGEALITVAAGSAQETTTILITEPGANQIALDVAPAYLPADGVSTASLVATVKDKWGNPSANQLVRIGTDQDGQFGTIGGSEVVTGTTDANGQFAAAFTAATTPGVVTVRAELLVLETEGYRAAHEAMQTIVVGASGENKMYLPLLQWH